MKNRRVAKRYCMLLTIFVAAAAGNTLAAQPAKLEAERTDAYPLLVGKYKDGVFPEVAVERVLAELRAIRAADPRVANIHAFPPFELQTLLMRVRGMVPTSLNRHERVVMFDRILSKPASTGIPKLDALNRQFQAASIRLGSLADNAEEGDQLIIHFANPLDMGIVASIYGTQLKAVANPTFLYVQADHIIGDGDRIDRVQNSNGSVTYAFSIGSGDCPAGCINRTFYRFNLFPEARGFRIESLPEDPGAASRSRPMPISGRKL